MIFYTYRGIGYHKYDKEGCTWQEESRKFRYTVCLRKMGMIYKIFF